MKKHIAMLAAVLLVLPIHAKTIYLIPNVWSADNAVFFAHSWGNTESDVPLNPVSETVYSAEIPDGNNIIIFVRMPNGSTSLDWDAKWNQTADLTIPNDKDCYTITGWRDTDGAWSQYEAGGEQGGGEEPEPVCPESYGLLVDGVYHAGTRNALQTEWKEYMLRSVTLTQGQHVQLYDSCNQAAWALDRFAETSYVFPIANNQYTVPEDGVYDFYIKFIYENDELFIAKHGTYTTAVRNQCEDVMMQAFYNESYNNSAPGVSEVGNTRWATLLPQAEEIGHYIDLIWLPPSAEGDGMGYHPKNYSNQNSNWGSRAELEALIAALHNAGAKVVADIVINHCTGWSSWCDFPTFDFGEYGVFHPDASYICKNDEVNAEANQESAGACWGTATGSYDDGENWEGARDWAHDMPEVQEMFKAYLKWMRNVMQYDGFRYDKGDGFNNWHHSNYNKAAGPYIAFMECYSGDDRIIAGIEGAERNLMALDFQTRWDAICPIAGFNYKKCAGSGLLGKGYSKYAVTFIDSHDWFLRPDNENEFGGRGNSLSNELKDRLLQANAYILGMPGVPCIFYPHWAKYKEALKPMIEARKLAGVHSESAVYDEQAEDGGYQCTLQGKYGWLVLQLGNKTNHSGWGDSAYTLVAQGNGYAMWVNRTAPLPSGTEDIQPVAVSIQKVLRDGRILILRGDQLYDITGNRVL